MVETFVKYLSSFTQVFRSINAALDFYEGIFSLSEYTTLFCLSPANI